MSNKGHLSWQRLNERGIGLARHRPGHTNGQGPCFWCLSPIHFTLPDQDKECYWTSAGRQTSPGALKHTLRYAQLIFWIAYLFCCKGQSSSIPHALMPRQQMRNKSCLYALELEQSKQSFHFYGTVPDPNSLEGCRELQTPALLKLKCPSLISR